ncbi:C39 family peptidase [Clostridium estertheticum]|uniref:C39 family peptidase n=1 Tax=Clostridium estertheticum TaxID=238834 RepID=UPI001C0BFAC1|nr:C39 family peptidase [Clostridium estertheticum]MBU3173286.1 C39 family peptidase [Clostridium estertheticum]
MAIPLAAVASKVAKKVLADVLTDSQKLTKVILLAVVLPILIVLILFAVPGVFIISVPSVLFGGGHDSTKYIAMYQEGIVDLSTRNSEWINYNKKKYSYDSITINEDCSVSWQELMAIDTALFTQDFSKTSKKHINNLADEFLNKTVKVITQSRKKKGSTTTLILTITTKSFDTMLTELDMDQTEKDIATNVYDTLISLYPESSTAIDDISSEIPLFHQWDSRWGNIPYGNHGTIATSACGPTSAAMVLTGLQANIKSIDLNKDEILDPKEAAAYAVSHNYRVEEGTDWPYFADIGHATGLNVREYAPSQYSEVLNELKKGHPVIASMGPGHFTSHGHFIVLVGILPNGKIKVNDPNREICSTTPWDFQSVIVPEALQFWAFDNPNRKSIKFEATAYTGAPDEGGTMAANGVNLSGKDLRNKYIAVDPRIIKLGTKVLITVPSAKRYQKMPDGTRVDMNGYYTAVDTGNAIKGYIIDLYFGTGSGYLRLSDSWGRENIQIYMK